MSRSGPTRLASVLEQALARLGLDRRLDDYRVWQAWDEVVGRTISRNAQPVRLDGTRLIVTVRSSTWLQELSLLQRELIDRVNEWMGREVIRELFFVVGRVGDERRGGPTRPATAPVGEPQGQRPLRASPASDEPTLPIEERRPPVEDLPEEAVETFERLWRAARGRAPRSGPTPRR